MKQSEYEYIKSVLEGEDIVKPVMTYDSLPDPIFAHGEYSEMKLGIFINECLTFSKSCVKKKEISPAKILSFYQDLVRHIPQTYRQHIANYLNVINQQKKIATVCSRELRRGLSRTSKTNPYLKNKRINKELIKFVSRQQRAEKEKIRKEDAEKEMQKKNDAAVKEELLQQRKFNYLMSQTEAFSNFFLNRQNRMQDGGEEGFKAARTHMKNIQEFDRANKRKNVLIENEEEDTECGRPIKSIKANFNVNEKYNEEDAGKVDNINLDAKPNTNKPGLNRSGFNNSKSDSLSFNTNSEAVYVHQEVEQPKILKTKLKEYQLKGLNWLVNLYNQGINGILADDMGLGKTVQSISFLGYLAEKENIWGPFLVITPASTIYNWETEFKKFIPEFRTIVYYGNQQERSEMRRKLKNINVVITSYQTAVGDEAVFRKIQWHYMILDEAQAIKSISSQRWKTLLGFKARNRCLLTGTPIQNNMQELWSLLHFIMPTLFDSLSEFSEWFLTDNGIDTTQVSKLHTILKPFMLRRHKDDIKDEIGTKQIVNLYCELTARQKILYEDILTARRKYPREDKGKNEYDNVIMQLKKVCNHPDLFEKLEPYSALAFTVSGASARVGFRSIFRKYIPFLVTTIASSTGFQKILRNYISLDKFKHYKLDNCTEIEKSNCKYINNFIEKETSNCKDKNDYENNSKAMNKRKYVESDIHNFIDTDKFLDKKTSNYVEIGKYDLCDDYPQDLIDCKAKRVKLINENMIRPIGNNRLNNKIIRFIINRNSNNSSGKHEVLRNVREEVLRQTRLLNNIRNRFTFLNHKVFYQTLTTNLPGERAVDTCRVTSYMTSNDSQMRISHITNPLNLLRKQTLLRNMTFVPPMNTFVSDSGKLLEIDKLLKNLKQKNSRPLIYFQMTKMMDLFEEYLIQMGYSYLRLDGSSKVSTRKDLVNEWQTKNIFIFMLSTRAGGVGLNLTAADTVIFYDSDWNPTVDQQAMDRVHRLGQTKNVTVYRLITKDTIEEKVMERANKKNEMQNIVIKDKIFEGN